MLDMDFTGPRFTWTNGWEGAAKIWERLDRAWCNAKRRLKAPEVVVTSLTRTLSNHYPILIECNPEKAMIKPQRTFKLQVSWLDRPKFLKLVENS